jgi:hypothetical protein
VLGGTAWVVRARGISSTLDIELAAQARRLWSAACTVQEAQEALETATASSPGSCSAALATGRACTCALAELSMAGAIRRAGWKRV